MLSYCFSTAKMVTRTPLNITFIHYIACLFAVSFLCVNNMNNEEGHHHLYVNNRRVFASMNGEALVCTRDVTSVNYNIWVRDRVVM